MEDKFMDHPSAALQSCLGTSYVLASPQTQNLLNKGLDEKIVYGEDGDVVIVLSSGESSEARLVSSSCILSENGLIPVVPEVTSALDSSNWNTFLIVRRWVFS